MNDIFRFNEKYIDFSALKEKLPEWIKQAQEEMKNDQSK